MTEIQQLSVHVEIPRWQLERLSEYTNTSPDSLDLAARILENLAKPLAEAFMGRGHWFPTGMVRITLTIEKPPRETP